MVTVKISLCWDLKQYYCLLSIGGVAPKGENIIIDHCVWWRKQWIVKKLYFFQGTSRH